MAICYSSSKPKILIVDDQEKNLVALEVVLEDVLADIVRAKSGQEALEKLVQDEYALVLLDVQMPGMDGFETAELMHCNSRTKQVPIIFVTANNKDDKFAQHGHEVGAVDYLFKPIDTTILISKVSVFLNYYTQKKEMDSLIKDLNKSKELLEESNQKLNKLAHYDLVTGLSNRLYFNKSLTETLDKAKRESSLLALLFLDLDEFKIVNDTHGHAAGDALLKEASSRILTCIRRSQDPARIDDTCVSRLGGDEFAIILTEINIPDDSVIVSERIIAELSRPFYLLDETVEAHIGVSIGISFYPRFAISGIDLCRQADLALYRAKNAGKNQYHLYTNEIHELYERKLIIDTGLKKALSQGAFSMVYQPIYDLTSNRIVAVEALFRCNLDELKNIPTETLISAAEESGLIGEIGGWIFSAVLSDYNHHIKNKNDHIYININVSCKQLSDDLFIKQVQSAFMNKEIPPERVTFELTETAVMKDVHVLSKNLVKLSELGSRISIDDFGSGCSSMARLRTLPISSLKIDQDFIADTDPDSNGAIIVKSIIQLAENLELTAIAEGIETQEQYDFISKIKCPLGQGHFMSKPLCISELSKLLSAEK